MTEEQTAQGLGEPDPPKPAPRLIHINADTVELHRVPRPDGDAFVLQLANVLADMAILLTPETTAELYAKLGTIPRGPVSKLHVAKEPLPREVRR